MSASPVMASLTTANLVTASSSCSRARRSDKTNHMKNTSSTDSDYGNMMAVGNPYGPSQ
jgi:hypothetical protein